MTFHGNFGFLQRLEEVGDDGSRADRGLILGGWAWFGMKYFDYKLCAGKEILFCGNFGFLHDISLKFRISAEGWGVGGGGALGIPRNSVRNVLSAGLASSGQAHYHVLGTWGEKVPALPLSNVEIKTIWLFCNSWMLSLLTSGAGMGGGANTPQLAPGF